MLLHRGKAHLIMSCQFGDTPLDRRLLGGRDRVEWGWRERPAWRRKCKSSAAFCTTIRLYKEIKAAHARVEGTSNRPYGYDCPMARTQTMVQLSDRLLGLLDHLAARRGVSRSQLVRDAVEAYLAEDAETEIDRQIVEGYSRMPQGGEFEVDDWGDLGKLVDFMAIATFRSLAAEEEEAGLEPW